MGWVFFVFTLIVLVGVALWGLNQRKKYIELFADFSTLENKMSYPVLAGQMVQIGQRTAYVLGRSVLETGEDAVDFVYVTDMQNAGIPHFSDPRCNDIQVTLLLAEYQGIVMPLDVRE